MHLQQVQVTKAGTTPDFHNLLTRKGGLFHWKNCGNGHVKMNHKTHFTCALTNVELLYTPMNILIKLGKVCVGWHMLVSGGSGVVGEACKSIFVQFWSMIIWTTLSCPFRFCGLYMLSNGCVSKLNKSFLYRDQKLELVVLVFNRNTHHLYFYKIFNNQYFPDFQDLWNIIFWTLLLLQSLHCCQCSTTVTAELCTEMEDTNKETTEKHQENEENKQAVRES